MSAIPYPRTPLRLGSSGDAVQRIQGALGVQRTGTFGATTEENVTRFQRAHGLEPDGVVGPLTWQALFAPPPAKSLDLGERALAIARTHIGASEVPRGSNRGPFVDLVNREIGVPLGSFWCMSFVQHCVKQAAAELGIAVPIKRTASCSDLFNWAKAHGRLVARPEPGDIFLCIGGPTGHFHTGFVAGSIDGNERWASLEGNSNSDGSANGYAVVLRKPGRSLGSCHYVRI